MPSVKNNEAIDALVGAEIKGARERAKLSMADLGRRIGMTRMAVYKYETGIVRIPVASLLLVAHALGRRPQSLTASAMAHIEGQHDERNAGTKRKPSRRR